ncbi:MAG: RNA ligase RtcB family protein [Gammaproteobacteria bacterium]
MAAGLWALDLPTHKLPLEKWVKRLRRMAEPWDGNKQDWLNGYGQQASTFDTALGTIGGGNHFAELQKIEHVVDQQALTALGVDPNRLVLLVHSGSRGLGEAILREHVQRYRGEGLQEDGDAAWDYLKRHAAAMVWATANRGLIAHRFAGLLGTVSEMFLDRCHNSVEPTEFGGCRCWLHRKGATPATQGPVVIPGSRGDWSYLVMPEVPAQQPDRGLYSLAHGAGRKFNRGEMKGRVRERCSAAALTRTRLGSHVICDDRDLLYEEAPQAYKDVDRVVRDLTDAGLARVIAVLRPLITYKTADLHRIKHGAR